MSSPELQTFNRHNRGGPQTSKRKKTSFRGAPRTSIETMQVKKRTGIFRKVTLINNKTRKVKQNAQENMRFIFF
jgi:hypothetical protein